MCRQRETQMLDMFIHNIPGYSLINNDNKEREKVAKRERKTATTVRFYNEAIEDHG